MFEKKGLRLSRLTLGTVQLGMPYGIANKSGQPDEEEAFRILQTAEEGGIRCLDTAHAYGVSEEVLGRYFARKSGGEPRPVIVSKIKLDLEDQASGLEVERMMDGQLEQSLKRLGLNRLPVLLLHNPHVLARHGRAIVKGLERLVRDGLIGMAGVSAGNDIDDQFRMFWPIIRQDLFEAVQIPINILDHRLFANGGLNKLRGSGKIVFARSIFVQGLIFLRDEELPGHLKDAAGPLAVLRDLSARTGLSAAQMAVSFIRDLPEIDSLVIGAETEKQLREILALMEGPPLPAEIRQELMERLSGVPEHVVNPVLWN